MAIDTNAEKLAIMEWDEIYEPALPLSPGASPFSQGEKQNFIWGFPGVDWAAAGGAVLIAQCRSISRRVGSRIFGRVN